MCRGGGPLTTLLRHSARLISVSSLFPKLPRDAMQPRADLFSDLQFRAVNDQRDANWPTTRHHFISERLRQPPAQRRGLARVVAGRAGGGAWARGWGAGLGTRVKSNCSSPQGFCSSQHYYRLEDLGFLPRGEAVAFIAERNTALGGKLPLNTNGGGLS
jgi:hypothetical protein